MDMIEPRAYRAMQTQILDHFCDRLEREAPSILDRCDQAILLNRAQRMYRAGGSRLSDDVRDKPTLIRKIVHVAQSFLVQTVQQHHLWIGDFEAARVQVQASAEQEFEGWMSRFEAWIDV